MIVVMSNRIYSIHLDPQSNGRFVVTVPALGCSTVGDNYEHALQMARECIETYIEGLARVGLSVPDSTPLKPFDTAVEVQVSAVA